MRLVRKTIESSTFRTVGIFAGGNLIVAFLGGLGGLIQGRWIGPEVLGEFRKFGILTVYFNIGLILVNEALSRQFPYLMGKGDKEEALKVAAYAKWWYLLLSWVFSLVFAVLVLVSMMKGDYRAAAGWGVQIPCVLTAIYGLYLNVMYRTSLEFERLSYNSVIARGVDFISLVFVNIWGYWGLAIRSLLGNTAGLFINNRYVPVRVKAAFNLRGLKDLARISLPLAIPGYIGSSFLTASFSFIVLTFCGEHGLGIYGMALSFQTMALIPTQAIHQMFITKLNYKYGETDDARESLKYIKVPTLLSVSAAAVMALILCLVIGPFMRILLPRYVEAIPVVRILAAQLPISAAGMPLIMFTTALWYKDLVKLTLVRVIVPLTAIALLPKTLNVIVSCIIIGGVCHMIAGYVILEWRMRRERVPGIA